MANTKMDKMDRVRVEARPMHPPEMLSPEKMCRRRPEARMPIRLVGNLPTASAAKFEPPMDEPPIGTEDA